MAAQQMSPLFSCLRSGWLQGRHNFLADVCIFVFNMSVCFHVFMFHVHMWNVCVCMCLCAEWHFRDNAWRYSSWERRAIQIHNERKSQVVLVLLNWLNCAAVWKMIHISEDIHISVAVQVLECPLPTWVHFLHCFTQMGVHTQTFSVAAAVVTWADDEGVCQTLS